MLPNETEIPLPTRPIDPKIMDLWVMHYRQGQNPIPMWKLFNHNGKFGDVVNRAKDHCNVMNYRFVSIRPAFVDLAEEEKRHVTEVTP